MPSSLCEWKLQLFSSLRNIGYDFELSYSKTSQECLIITLPFYNTVDIEVNIII